MNYDSFCMAAALDELRGSCSGAFVDQVYQPGRLEVVLAFTGRGPRRLWLFSSDAARARAHAIPVRKPGPETPPGFCMLLRKHLGGAHLTGVEQVRFDRVLRLTFRRGAEIRVLVHEVMGRHSNLILLDESALVLGAIKHVPPAQTRVRPILPGLRYAEPPGARPDPRALSLDDLRALLEGVTAPEELTRRLSGWGTFAAREAFAMPGGPAEAVHALMERVRSSDYEPVVFEDERGCPRGVWAFPSAQSGWEHARPGTGISAVCAEYYRYLEEHGAAEELRRFLAGTLGRALKTARLQRDEARSHLEGIDGAELLRISGELLSAHAGAVERGARQVELPNWYDPAGGTLTIRLDSELDARENAQRYFHRYRRAIQAAEAALERLPGVELRAAELEQRAAAARTAEEPELRLALEVARAEGLLRDQERPGRSAAPRSEFPSGVRVKRVPLGRWEILYGENATSNDYLTTRYARPGDLWLHARAVTGAHVVVREVGSLERLPPEVLREAARLAAAHSEAKHSSLVPVDYTFRRFVRKPRGSAPGAVAYTGEKTIHVEPR